MKKFLKRGLALAVCLTMLLSANVVFAEDTATQPLPTDTTTPLVEHKDIEITGGEFSKAPVKGSYLQSNMEGVITSEFDVNKLAKMTITFTNHNISYENVVSFFQGYENVQFLIEVDDNVFVDVDKSGILLEPFDINAYEEGVAEIYINPTKAGEYSGKFCTNANEVMLSAVQLPTFTVKEADVPEFPVRTKPFILTSEKGIKIEIPASITSIINPAIWTDDLNSDFYAQMKLDAKDYELIKGYSLNMVDLIQDKDVIYISKIKDGKVKVTIPFEGEKNAKYTIVGYGDEGVIKAFDSTYANGAITFETDHIGEYSIAVSKKDAAATATTKNPTTTATTKKPTATVTTKVPLVPQTSDESPVGLATGLGLAGILLLYISKKHLCV